MTTTTTPAPPPRLVGTCKTCKHFDRTTTEAAQGLCRESSPQVSIVMLPQQSLVSKEIQMVPQMVANFPQVGDDCWCGRWDGKWAKLAN